MGSVLIVEDEFLTAMSLEFSLQEAGHEVRVARDGRQALELLRTASVDVVVTDYMMPRMDGGELIAALRAGPETRDVRIVLTTSVPPERLAAEMSGYDAYLRKPVREDRLVAVVEALLAER